MLGSTKTACRYDSAKLPSSKITRVVPPSGAGRTATRFGTVVTFSATATCRASGTGAAEASDGVSRSAWTAFSSCGLSA
ncbi:hypothetical protein Aco03nite_091810 [Actinoplanes couchii]|uniref:Uncharacterized protein n=1 Tax=Actinoplanes couchii TaxID=403638 RepID=A0ABQ3XQJ3_9ACTN|nr:hypothetical protein Aco03nite_091810 [Actinoplanes couchii]